VAQTFEGNNAVIFDLFNEPYASRATGSATSGAVTGALVHVILGLWA